MGSRKLAGEHQPRREYGEGFKLTKTSKFAPSLNTRHRGGLAIDMDIKWTGTIWVKKKGGPKVPVIYGPVNANKVLHEIGASYGVKKLLSDDPHWSDDGR